MKKIDWLVSQFKIIGGAEVFIRQAAPLLRQMGWDLRVITLVNGGEFVHELREAGVPVVELGARNRLDLRVFYRLSNLWKKDSPHLVHTHLYHAGIVGRYIAHALGIRPVIVHQHGLEQARSPFRTLLDRVTSLWVDRYLATCQAVSHNLQNREGIPADKIEVIPVGIPIFTKQAKPKPEGWPIPNSAIGIAYVGRLVPAKGQLRMLEALSLLPANAPSYHVVFLGTGQTKDGYYRLLQKRVQELGLEGKVSFTGFRDDVREWLPHFDIFALTSDWEGISVAILEAMAAGLPIIATAVGGTPEIVKDGETGFLCPLDDPQALSSAILKLLKNPQLRCQMGQSGQRRVQETFSLGSVIHQLDSFYQKQLTEPKARVLHIITRLIVGGAQENTMFTAALLDKRRFQVEVLSGPQTGSEGSLIEEVRKRGISLTILPDLLRQISPVYDLRALWKIARLLRRERFTIVHTHSSKAGILGRLAAWLTGVPIIIHTVHGWSFHDYMPKFLQIVYILLERLTALMSDALIVVSEQDLEKGLRQHIGTPHKYHLVRSAIPLEDFNPANYNRQKIRKELGISSEAIVIGNVGRFSEQKNPLDWVHVAGEVGRRHPETHFLLVGDGPIRPQVEALLKSEGIIERATLPGLRRDVPPLLAGMDIFLITSLWEGLPRVIPQAMAMGLPVVANLVGGIGEVVQDGVNGFLCSPGDINRMADKCSELILNPNLRREMGEQARSLIKEKFDLQYMIHEIERLYLLLIENKLGKKLSN